MESLVFIPSVSKFYPIIWKAVGFGFHCRFSFLGGGSVSSIYMAPDGKTQVKS